MWNYPITPLPRCWHSWINKEIKTDDLIAWKGTQFFQRLCNLGLVYLYSYNEHCTRPQFSVKLFRSWNAQTFCLKRKTRKVNRRRKREVLHLVPLDTGANRVFLNCWNVCSLWGFVAPAPFLGLRNVCYHSQRWITWGFNLWDPPFCSRSPA